MKSKEAGDAVETDALPTPRIYGIVAREQPICVIFRRGPSSVVQVLRWNTETSVISEGQWLKGRIYEQRGDLSPDGELMTYFAAKRSNPDPLKHTWTAISKPPYLTALALWFKGDSWGGGALFESSSRVLLNDPEWKYRQPYVPDPEKPCRLTTAPLGASRGEEWPIELIRLERDGWVYDESSDVPTLTKTQGDYVLRAVYSGFRTPEYQLQRLGSKSLRLEGIGWADLDCNGQLVGSRDGALVSASLEQALANDFNVIRDLTNNRFESVKAPEWAIQW